MAAPSSGNESNDDLNITELPFKDQLLKYARDGNVSNIRELVTGNPSGVNLINTKGQNKANREWTPLHLASYFGHTDVASYLIELGADINITNDKGDTPLHKAAFTGRLDVVTMLLTSNADVNIINTEGKTALQVSRHQDIKQLIEAAQLTESVKLEKKFLHFASAGDLTSAEKVMKEYKSLNINCVDDLGNSALHLAAYRDRQEMAAFLMQAGVRSDTKNGQGQLAVDVATSQGMKQVLSLTQLSDLRKTVTRFEGVLYKKTRLFGFKPKYVVLDRGVLTIFNTLADATSGVKRRTFKYLDDAKCLVQTRDNLGIALVYNNGSTHIFRVAASNQDEDVSRQKWVNAFRSHIDYSTYYIHKGLGQEDSDEFDELVPLSTVNDTIKTAQAHQTALEKEVKKLITFTDHLNSGITPAGTAHYNTGILEAITRCSKIALSSREMCSVLQHCLTQLTQQEQLRSQQLVEEKERCRVLQESLRLLAVQQHELEQQLETSEGYHSPMASNSDNSSDEEFFDCDLTGTIENGDSPIFKGDSNIPCSSSSPPSSSGFSNSKRTSMRRLKRIKKHKIFTRTELPAPMLSRNEFSVWSILKQCIGKELSKITMPVVFNEPITFLQKLSESMEYCYLLERASACEAPEERMAYIAAFVVSINASTYDRLGKPFNPLLGETFELDREDLGFKLISEQVSHHPPISALYATSDDYNFYGSVNPKIKFWGKSVEISAQGLWTIELKKHGEAYTYENVNCSVHNIIIGKLWIEHNGRMEILNHKTGHRCDLTYKKSNIFSKEVYKIEGCIYDSQNTRLLMVYGSWIDSMFAVEPSHWDIHLKSEKHRSKSNSFSKDSMKSLSKSLSKDENSDEEEIPLRPSSFDLRIPGQIFLWQAAARPENSDRYYSFTKFSMMLNELDEANKSSLCPTDSKLRPDVRSLELGNIDQAAEKKLVLEEKQRATRKQMKKNKEEWTPRWFKWASHPITGKLDWVYQQKYWDRNWSNCPDIF